jgi:hypothetical protein
VEYQVVGRGSQSAKLFADKTGIDVVQGGVDRFFRLSNRVVDKAIALEGNGRMVSINEKNGWAVQSFKNGFGETSMVNFSITPGSEQTKLIVDDIFRRGDCGLPAYDESSKLHLSLLSSLIAKANAVEGPDWSRLPIT